MGALGASWGPLGPILATKTARNHFFGPQLGRQNGAKNPKKSMLKNNLCSDTFFFTNFLDFSLIWASNFDVFSDLDLAGILNGFWEGLGGAKTMNFGTFLDFSAFLWRGFSEGGFGGLPGVI